MRRLRTGHLLNSPGQKAGDRIGKRAHAPVHPRPSGLGCQRRCRGGYFTIDAIVGLMIIATVTVGLLVTVRHERTAEQNLADSRSALHLAEHALLNLQHGQPMPAPANDAHLAIHPATGGIPPAGYVWATVDATVHGHHRSLIGVVPVGSIPAPGAK